MKGALLLALALLVAVPAAAQTTIQATDPSTHTTAPEVGDVADHALRTVCVNPVSHLLESCGGSGGGGGNVVITDPGAVNQAAVNASGQLSITCANCSGSGASAVDGSTFTQGTNSVAPSGILFKTSYTALTSGQVGIIRGFSDGSLFAMGSVASAATDSGNPIKIGSVFLTTQPTVTNGQRVDSQATARGALIVATGVDAFTVAGAVTANAGTNLNTSALALETGGNLAAIKTDVDKIPSQGQALAAASMPVVLTAAQITTLTPPAAIVGFATAAKQPALGTAGSASADVITVQGVASMTPVQVSQATASNLNATVVQGTGTNLHMVCDSGCSSSTAPADEAAFTAGTTSFGIGGGFFQTTATSNALTTGQMGAFQLTSQRALFTNLRNASGTEIGTSATPLVVSQATAASLNATVVGTGTFATQSAVTAASGSIASGAVASGAVASGAYASGSISDGAEVTLGAKADAKSTATDTTSITAMQVLKEISFMEQTPASRAVTNAGTFATQSAITAASGSIASGAIASGAIASGAVASGAVASGAFASGSIADGAEVTLGSKADAKSTATDTTAITVMQVLKEISAVTQAPPSQAPTPSAASGDAFTECVILSAASTNSTNCKASAGNFISYELFNTTTTVYYLRLYNASGAPTCSSATGFIRSIPIPPASAAGGVGGVVSNNTIGVQYATGIAYCLTGGSSSTDNTNAAAGVFGSLKVK